MNYKALLLLCFMLSAVLKAQVAVKFDSIADHVVMIGMDDEEALLELNRNLSSFVGHGVDDLDLQIYRMGPMLAGLMLDIIETDSGELTYRKLLNQIISKKEDSDYLKIRETIIVTNKLAECPAMYKYWHENKKLLLSVQFPKEQIDAFELYVKTHENPALTYKELIVGFTEIQKAKNPQRESLNRVSSEEFAALFTYDGPTDYPSLLEESNRLQKPLLLFFTGHACVNARIMEEDVLHDVEIFKLLKEDYLFVALYADENTALPEEEWVTDEETGRVYKTVGARNARLQEVEFQRNSQPYFVIVNGEGEQLDFFDHTKENNEFLNFLKRN